MQALEKTAKKKKKETIIVAIKIRVYYRRNNSYKYYSVAGQNVSNLGHNIREVNETIG